MELLIVFTMIFSIIIFILYNVFVYAKTRDKNLYIYFGGCFMFLFFIFTWDWIPANIYFAIKCSSEGAYNAEINARKYQLNIKKDKTFFLSEDFPLFTEYDLYTYLNKKDYIKAIYLSKKRHFNVYETYIIEFDKDTGHVIKVKKMFNYLIQEYSSGGSTSTNNKFIVLSRFCHNTHSLSLD